MNLFWAGYLARIAKDLRSDEFAKRYAALESYEDYLDRAIFDREAAAQMRKLMDDIAHALDTAAESVRLHLREVEGGDDAPVKF